MARRAHTTRLDCDDEVWVEPTEKHANLLKDMGLTDDSGSMLKGIRMFGKIVSKTNNYFKIRLPAAEEDLFFPINKTNKVENETAPKHFVVVPDDHDGHHIKEVQGLLLPEPVKGYHTTKANAVRELRETVPHPAPSATADNPTTTTASSSASSTTSTTISATSASVTATNSANATTASTPSVNPPSLDVLPNTTAPTTTSTTVANGGLSQAEAAITATTTTTHRRGRSRSATRPELNDTTANESESESVSESGDDFDNISDSSCDDGVAEVSSADDDDADDFMTDEEDEEQSDHEEVVLTWKPPKAWEKDREEHPLLRELGEAEWKVPADRGACPTQNSGPRQEPRFRQKVNGDNYLRLFLDALPILTFWDRIVKKQSRLYGENKVSVCVC